MGWNGYPISGAINPTARTWLYQLYDNVRQRQRALNQFVSPLPTIGQTCNLATKFSDLQSWVETNCSSFVRSHNADGSARSITYYTGTSLEYWSWATLKTAAGIPNGWTAKPVSGGTTYRQAQGNCTDFWGIHLYNELYQCITKLLWVSASVSANAVVYFRWATDGQSVGSDVVSSSTRPTIVTIPTGATSVTIGHAGTWTFDSYQYAAATPDSWNGFMSGTTDPAYQSSTLGSDTIERLSSYAGLLMGVCVDDYSGGPFTPSILSNGSTFSVSNDELLLGMFDDGWYNNAGTVNVILHWNTLV